MSKLSPEAQRAKYQYNKKYVDAYWERRAKRTETTEERTSGRSVRKTVERSSVEVRVSQPETPVSFAVEQLKTSDVCKKKQ